MKLYKLPFVMHQPGGDNEDKYLAEIPSIPGMQGMGRYGSGGAGEPAERGHSLHRILPRQGGDALPPGVADTVLETHDSSAMSEVLVAV